MLSGPYWAPIWTVNDGQMKWLGAPVWNDVDNEEGVAADDVGGVTINSRPF